MKKIIIDREKFKQRIDKFLAREFFSYTRGEIIRNIKSGNITVSGKKIKPSYVLKENDEIKIDLKLKTARLEANPKVKFSVVYSDKKVIAVDKPSGLKVHPVKYENDTLVNGLLAKFPEIKTVGDPSNGSGQANLRPGIVHRLDKDTSGIMVVARKQDAFLELKKLFQKREIKKEYLAVVFGKLKNKKGLIEKPIARAESYKKQTIASARTRTKIRSAATAYEVLKEYKNYSLVRVVPKTGRMHQIRVHLASLGHPIVGDTRYKVKKIIQPKGIKRQLLHAQKLEFELCGKYHSFESAPPKDFSQFLTENP